MNCKTSWKNLVLVQSDEQQQGVNTYTDSSWEAVIAPSSVFQEYLDVDVDCVQLPACGAACRYPFVVLDGASGTGKTQQAFSLLKAGGMKRGMVYINFFSDQPIYKDLRQVFNENNDLIDTAVHDLSAAGVSFDVEDLEKAVRNNNPVLKPLVQHLTESMRYCDIGNNIFRFTGQQLLRDSILFVDEALSGTSEACHDRLRFLRNLGRALRMRVVVAGTSATTATLIDPPKPKKHESSRSKLMEGAWAVVIFLRRKYVNFNPSEHHPHLQNLLREGRPWLVNISREDPIKSGLARDTILHIAGEIMMNKKTGEGPLLMEQAGIWLQGNFVSPLPFQTKSEELIKMSFFEPSIRVMTGEHSTPYLGEGMAKVTQKDGPLRVVVQNMKVSSGLKWVLGHRKEMFNRCDASVEEVRTLYINQVGVTTEFEDIQDTFGCCVQQCLVREPILALAMTVVTQSIIWPKLQSGLRLSCILRPSITRRTIGEVDGASFEHIARIVVQLASWQKDPSIDEANQIESLRGGKKTLNNFLSDVFAILSSQGSAPKQEALDNVLGLQALGVQNTDWAKPKFKRKSWNMLVSPLLNDLLIGRCLESFKVPWLVSACNIDRLREVISNNPELESLDIAGLVPHSEPNSYLDNTVLRWTAIPEDELMFLAYTSRRGVYSANEALDDLKVKMDTHFKAMVASEANTLAAGIMSVKRVLTSGMANLTAAKEDDNDMAANEAQDACILELKKVAVADEIKVVNEATNAAVEAVNELVVAGDMSVVTEVVAGEVDSVIKAASAGMELIAEVAVASATSYIQMLEKERDACIWTVIKAAAANEIKVVNKATNAAVAVVKNSVASAGKLQLAKGAVDRAILSVNRAAIAGFEVWLDVETDIGYMEAAHKLSTLGEIETIKATSLARNNTNDETQLALRSLDGMDKSVLIKNEINQAKNACVQAMHEAAKIGDIVAAHNAAEHCVQYVETAARSHIEVLMELSNDSIAKLEAMEFTSANRVVGPASSKKAKAACTMALNRGTAAEKATATNKDVALRCMAAVMHEADTGIAAVKRAVGDEVAVLQDAQDAGQFLSIDKADTVEPIAILEEAATAQIEVLKKKAAAAGTTAENQSAAVDIANENLEAAKHKGNKTKATDHKKKANATLRKIQRDSEATLLEEFRPVDRVCLLLGISGATDSVMGANFYERTIQGITKTELHIALVMGFPSKF